MTQRHSPWRGNDAAEYDALRDEVRSALAGLTATADVSTDEVVGAAQQLRSNLYGVDGFDRTAVASHLESVGSGRERLHTGGANG
ncbi:hypothetical protein AB0N64_05770 [Microbacterium sp. NPDC089318]